MGYDKLAPFRHPSIIAILQDVVFKGSRGSALSEKHSIRFPTIPATELHPKRRMLSEAMVCMAATAVLCFLFVKSSYALQQLLFDIGSCYLR